MASRTLPGLGLSGDWDLGENNWKNGMDANLLLLSVIVGGRVASRLSATPGAPAEGDIHIFKADHPTQADKIAVYDEGAWVYFTPWNGLRLYSTADSARYEYTVANGWLLASVPSYNYGSFAVSGITANEVLMDHIVTTAHTLPDDFAGAQASVGTNPASTWTATIAKNGDAIGSLAISAGGIATFSTIGAAVSVAVGDVISLMAPATVDAAIARLRFTLKGVM